MNKTSFFYKNHRGVTEFRTIVPVSLDYVATPHPEYGYGPGWFLHGLDYTERDGVARNGEPRSFALSNIQMKDFRLPMAMNGAGPSFRIFLDGLDAPLSPLKVNDKPPIEIVLNSETGGDPVPSHGGLAQLVRWELLVNGVLIESEDDRFRWNIDPAKRELNTRIDKAPYKIKALFDSLCAAVGTPNPPVEAYQYNKSAVDEILKK